jgi:hypothetical protein
VVDHQGAVEALGEHRLLVPSEVVAGLHRQARLAQALGGLRVGEAGERSLDRLESREVSLENREFGTATLEHPLDKRADEPLGQLDVALQVEKGGFRLDHPELHQVPTRLRLLGAKRRSEAIHAAEGLAARLGVELAALREVGLLAEVVRLE